MAEIFLILRFIFGNWLKNLYLAFKFLLFPILYYLSFFFCPSIAWTHTLPRTFILTVAWVQTHITVTKIVVQVEAPPVPLLPHLPLSKPYPVSENHPKGGSFSRDAQDHTYRMFKLSPRECPCGFSVSSPYLLSGDQKFIWEHFTH